MGLLFFSFFFFFYNYYNGFILWFSFSVSVFSLLFYYVTFSKCSVFLLLGLNQGLITSSNDHLHTGCYVCNFSLWVRFHFFSFDLIEFSPEKILSYAFEFVAKIFLLWYRIPEILKNNCWLQIMTSLSNMLKTAAAFAMLIFRLLFQ